MTALRQPSDNEAESERRRDLALRAVAAHIATVDRIESAAHQATSGAVPADERDTIAWVERGDREARYEVNAAPFEVGDFLQGHALRAHAERGAHERDARRGPFVCVLARDRSASRPRKN